MRNKIEKKNVNLCFRYKNGVDIIAMLKEKGYTPTRIRTEKILGEATMTALRRGQIVSFQNYDTLCEILDCDIGDLITHIPLAEQNEMPIEGQETFFLT